MSKIKDFYPIFPKNEDEYLQTRVLDQIVWYDKSSAKNKKWFFFLKISEIILALFIPFLAAYIKDESWIKIAVGILGILVSAIAGILTLIKFHENWIEFRTVAESLKYENFLFLSKAGPYKDSEDAFRLFVERFENLISTSTKKWVSYIVTKDGSKESKK